MYKIKKFLKHKGHNSEWTFKDTELNKEDKLWLESDLN